MSRNKTPHKVPFLNALIFPFTKAKLNAVGLKVFRGIGFGSSSPLAGEDRGEGSFSIMNSEITNESSVRNNVPKVTSVLPYCPQSCFPKILCGNSEWYVIMIKRRILI
jgi:hypothetical protein